MARGYNTVDNGGGLMAPDVSNYNFLRGGYTQMAWVRLVDNASTGVPHALGINEATNGDGGLVFDRGTPILATPVAVSTTRSVTRTLVSPPPKNQ